ncbi:hypothetical protein BH18ACI4_BH18ACI4_14840 [soil metagenome]
MRRYGGAMLPAQTQAERHLWFAEEGIAGPEARTTAPFQVCNPRNRLQLPISLLREAYDVRGIPHFAPNRTGHSR